MSILGLHTTELSGCERKFFELTIVLSWEAWQIDPLVDEIFCSCLTLRSQVLSNCRNIQSRTEWFHCASGTWNRYGYMTNLTEP